jgi:hypothetical protein
MKPLLLIIVMAVPISVRADAVLDWNELTLQTIRRNNTPPPVAARTLAMVHGAIYDALNSIERTHDPLRVLVAEASGASPQAAAAQSAFRVLVSVYPNEKSLLEDELRSRLATVADGSGKSAGIRLGEIVAARIMAWRSNDNSSTAYRYRPGIRPGDWQPTPPGFKSALLPQWKFVTPFGIPSAASFRPSLPPPLSSSEYGRDLLEVQSLGSTQSLLRTAEQTDIANFWADGAGTVTPPGHWNRIAQTVARSANTSLNDNARLFALLNIALADAAIVCWDAKFSCHLWRPVTAIQNADQDGNDLTLKDSGWLPLLETPPFPSCTSGHSTFSGAASQVLALFFQRDNMPFRDSSEGRLSSREFAGFSQAAEEAGRSRIYGGIHFEFDNQGGLKSGRAVGRYIFDHLLRNRSQPRAGEIVSREAYRLSPSIPSQVIAPSYGSITTFSPTAEVPNIWHSVDDSSASPQVGYSGSTVVVLSPVEIGVPAVTSVAPTQILYACPILHEYASQP